jgi:hypothetical protein
LRNGWFHERRPASIRFEVQQGIPTTTLLTTRWLSLGSHGPAWPEMTVARSWAHSGVHWARYWAFSTRQLPASSSGKNGRSCTPPWVYTVSCRKSATTGSALQAGGRQFDPAWLHWDFWGRSIEYGPSMDHLDGPVAGVESSHTPYGPLSGSTRVRSGALLSHPAIASPDAVRDHAVMHRPYHWPRTEALTALCPVVSCCPNAHDR